MPLLRQLARVRPLSVPVVARTAHPPHGGRVQPTAPAALPKNSTPRPLQPGRGA